MKLSDAIPEPWRSLPPAQVDYPETLQRLRTSGWWNKARLRTYWCQAVKAHLLAELVDLSDNPVLLIRADATGFDDVPGFGEMSFAKQLRVAQTARHVRIRAEWQAWTLHGVAAWRQAFIQQHGDADDLIIPAVCQCGRHDLDLYKVLSDYGSGDRRRVVLRRNGHSV